MLRQSQAFSVSWVPSDVVAGASRLPFRIGVARADEPPPDRVEDPQELLRHGAARQVNDLRAWVEFADDGTPHDFGYASEGSGWAQLEFPDVRREPELDGNAVRFVSPLAGASAAQSRARCAERRLCASRRRSSGRRLR